MKLPSFYKIKEVSKKFKDLNANIIALYQSRKSYELAVNAEQKDLYEVAYENYKKVIKTDSNYTVANDKMITLCPLIANQFYVLAKGEYELANYSKAFDYIGRALGYEQNNQDMLKFINECVAKYTAQKDQIVAENIQKTAENKEYYYQNTTAVLPDVLTITTQKQ